MTNRTITDLCTAIQAVSDPAGYAWLRAVLPQQGQSLDAETELAPYLARARRSVGTMPLRADTSALATPVGELAVGHWLAGDAARVVLLLSAVGLGEAVPILSDAFAWGDENERAALIRGLALFRWEPGLKAIALEAGRTNSLILFSALAQHNPFPAAHYTEPEFNQLVLKALFMGVAIEAVQGLPRRANPALSRMCLEYIAERRAAGREFPADIWLALLPAASREQERQAMDALRHEDARHRHYAAIARSRKRATHAAIAAETVVAERTTVNR